MRKVVLLPQPEGPTSTMNSRSAMSRSMPCTAGVLSNVLTMLRSATCAISHPFVVPAITPAAGASVALILLQPCEIASSILPLLALGQSLPESGAEDACIILTAAAVPLQLERIAA